MKKQKKTSINQHHTVTMGRMPDAIQGESDAVRDQAMTPMANHIPVGNIAPSQDYWGHQQPTPVLGNSTI